MKKFIENIQKGTLPFIIAFSALSVSASAAFYSVSGLSKLFAGASFEVTIMAASLEVAKLVIASLLYQYWDTLNKLLRTYLTVAAFILVLITSMGIYGFLSAAYQDTYRQLTMKNNQTAFLEQKKEFYENDVIRYDEELARISKNISTLSNAKATSIQVRDTTSSTGLRSTISTAELRLAQKRIGVEEENRKSVQAKREVAADSLQKYQLAILDLENNTEVAGELGPLEYLSGLTGVPMDKIINYLLLVIIFVFDPLAISLVVAANFAFAQAFPKREEETVDPFAEWNDDGGLEFKEPVELEPDPEDLPDLGEIEVLDAEEVSSSAQFEEQLSKIEQKHYEVYGETASLSWDNPPEEEWEVIKEASSDFDDNITIQNKIKKLERQLLNESRTSITQRRKTDLENQISQLRSQLNSEEDLTIRY